MSDQFLVLNYCQSQLIVLFPLPSGTLSISLASPEQRSLMLWSHGFRELAVRGHFMSHLPLLRVL